MPDQDDQDNEDHLGTVWIRTDPGTDGVYRPTLEVNDDTSITLDHDLAMRYGEYVLIQVARAEHDSRVFRQLASKAGATGAIQVLVDMRKDRPEVTSPIADISLSTGVSQATQEGFLKVHIKGGAEPVGQWSLEQGRNHALHMIQAIEVANLDGSYRRALVGEVGLDDLTARTVVADLQNWEAK